MPKGIGKEHVMKNKTAVEILLVKAELTGLPEKRLLKSRNLGTVELIWPRTGVAKKSAARQMVFKLGKADLRDEPWAKRVLYREEIEGKCGIAVSISEPVTVQKFRKFAKLTAKAIIKEGADVVQSLMVSHGDIAAAPIDALAAIVGESEAPKAIAQGVIDFTDLPAEGEEIEVAIPLQRPLLGRAIGSLTLLIRAC